MARLAAEARRQVLDLIRHFADLERIEAVDRLNDAVEEALRRADGPTGRMRRFPATYRELAAEGALWFKAHRYWFGCVHVAGEAVITNVLYDRSNIPDRINR